MPRRVHLHRAVTGRARHQPVLRGPLVPTRGSLSFSGASNTRLRRGFGGPAPRNRDANDDRGRFGGVSAAAVPARRQRNARGEGDRLRADLLEAAANLMATHGDVESISLRSVAREAGVSATAVYRHFDDHHDLLRESVEYCWTNFRQALVQSIVGVDDPFDALQSMRSAYVQFALDHAGQYRVMFSNRVRHDGASATIGLAAYQLLVDAVAAILAELDDTRDPYFVAAQLHTWLHGVVDLWTNHPEVSWPGGDQLIESMTRVIGLDRPVDG